MAVFSKYFKLEEFLTSSTARVRGIENMPSWTIVEHLRELALFLDGLREAWGSGIRITSGFRNTALNKAVNGVYNSGHLSGFAADLYPANGKFEEFKKFIVNWAKNKKYDQLIIERNSRGDRWIHLSLYGNNGQQRKQSFSLSV